MKKKISSIFIIILILMTVPVFAAQNTYTVKYGDTMWKIASRYEIGLSEIINSNTQIKNPSLIYPGQKITIPTIKETKSIEDQVIKLVNIERSKNGLPSLKKNWELSRVARYKSTDMRDKNYFSHTSPTYGSPFKMMEDFGIRYTAAGENIAHGQRTAESVMDGWMNSPGHRKNILSSSFDEIGVGIAKDNNGGYYWTQMFIRATK
ncbi:SafA/ExsA family spore coat assembly protein [Senegalia massiliensis]|uniref:LysM peptidoglycan-binding domain-containing protein n=1 Tax=Senegalia massiliensis TaxID=1720316 RepID=A0A845R1M8_9CLOT|nr:SafA/ExsA family spore coat assembly protein [Senegalia massiliensis]NBI08320.1 LysM peptidoglycan-binding domain-containing protein [Senegalia massiliensis]